MMEETHLRTRRQTVKLGLVKVVGELFPGEQLKIEYSIQEGVFCRLSNSLLSHREVRQIAAALGEWVSSDQPVTFLGHEGGYHLYDVGGVRVRALYAAEPKASEVEPFNFIPFRGGFIVDFGDVKEGGEPPLIPPERLSEAYEKTQHWLRNISVEVVADVNAYVDAGRGHELLGIAEALQEKEISDIADMILAQRRALRVLLISGPSASGKTSFAQRLATQLRVNGLRPVPLSLDDYFVNRADTPKDEEGKPDFERLETLDLEFLQGQVADLIAGKSVQLPCFDFVRGCRSEQSAPLRLGADEILVLEGIHALNPHLLPEISRTCCWKIYINALFLLNVDLVNRIPTTEVRLIRRLVRGEKFRGTHPETTIDQWASVRRGEYLHVFRYQEEADAMFNSSMLYELHALRPFAEAALGRISDTSRHAPTRDRLRNLLGFFHPLDDEMIPHNSILREFIGGSIYFDGNPSRGVRPLPH